MTSEVSHYFIIQSKSVKNSVFFSPIEWEINGTTLKRKIILSATSINLGQIHIL